MDESPSSPGSRTESLYHRARRVAPGGVHSNVRLLGSSRFIERAKGAWLYDVDGRDYVDHLLGQGPNFLGHSPAPVRERVAAACRDGIIYGGQHPLEIEAGEAALSAIGWADLIRFGVSGTESVHAAVRLARAHSGRPLIVRFEGHYHGWLDDMLMAYDGTTWGAGSSGQRRGALGDQIVLAWNDPAAVTDAFNRHGEDIAAVITEPMMLNAGAIEPRPGYLEHLRSATEAHSALLIFDEVITGFRLSLAGGAGLYGVTPDLAIYGKALAGGWPVSAVAGRGDIMERFGTGEVNHSGTFNSSVMAMAATAATLEILTNDPPYERVATYGAALMAHFEEISRRRGIAMRLQGVPAAFHVAFGEGEVHDARSLHRLGAHERYAALTGHLVDHGVWVTNRGIWYTSAEHGRPELEAVMERTAKALDAHLEAESRRR